jgi:hypothetical protein
VACSSHLGLSIALDHVVKIQPDRVLDLGVGLGKWGFLMREALDFIDGRSEREDWTTVIDGVDGHRYDSPLIDWIYDSVTIADLREVVDDLRGYDLVTMGDIIEHLEKDEGLDLLSRLLAHNDCVVLTTPVHFFEQEVADNPFQSHRSHWTADDFRPWKSDVDEVGGVVLVAALGAAGSKYPSASAARASRLVSSLGPLKHRGSAARVVKALAQRIT